MKISDKHVFGAISGLIGVLILILGYSLNKNVSSIEGDIEDIKKTQEAQGVQERETFELVAELSGRLIALEPKR